VRHHATFQSFIDSTGENAGIHAFSRHASAIYTEAKVGKGDYLLFGQETQGLPQDLREAYPCYRIPIWGKVRSLNMATAVGIVVYRYLHQLGRF
jgi:tRNA (cytidine/uridine-2'-O-)-methyltransferase